MSKKIGFLVTLVTCLSFFVCSFSSCSKSTTTACTYVDTAIAVPASELADLQTYVSAHHPAAVLDPRGFYYEIVAPGSGSVATVCSTVNVKYSGYLTTGAKFDANTVAGITAVLGTLVPGWQKGLPLIQTGGSINLYLPPTLGYGVLGSGSIPGNSILIFYMQLVSVQ